MTIRIDATRQKLADTYGTLGTFLGLAVTDPGTDAAPASEPGFGVYQRVATTWSSGTKGVVQGTPCMVPVDAGAYDFAILCADASGPTMIDNAQFPQTVSGSSGQIVLTPTYTQS
jgi:hypothetical protein